jgi:hypothetical protein
VCTLPHAGQRGVCGEGCELGLGDCLSRRLNLQEKGLYRGEEGCTCCYYVLRLLAATRVQLQCNGSNLLKVQCQAARACAVWEETLQLIHPSFQMVVLLLLQASRGLRQTRFSHSLPQMHSRPCTAAVCLRTWMEGSSGGCKGLEASGSGARGARSS